MADRAPKKKKGGTKKKKKNSAVIDRRAEGTDLEIPPIGTEVETDPLDGECAVTEGRVVPMETAISDLKVGEVCSSSGSSSDDESKKRAEVDMSSGNTERIQTEVDSDDVLMAAVEKMRNSLEELEGIVRTKDEKAIRSAIQAMKFELGYALEKSREVEKTCTCCKGQMTREVAVATTQTPRKLLKEELRAKIAEAGDDDFLELVMNTWPEDVYVKTKLVKNSEDANGADRVLIHDVRNKTRGHLKDVPSTAYMAKSGKLVAGQLIAEPPSAEVLLGEGLEAKKGRFFTLVLDSQDLENSVRAAKNGISKLQEVCKGQLQFVMTGDKLGQAVRKVLEIMFVRAGREVACLMEKVVPEKRRPEVTGPPSRTMVVKVQGKTYADLLKEVREQVAHEGAEILSVRKTGEGDGMQLRVKEGPNAGAIKEVIQQKVHGAVVTSVGARSRLMTFHVKDLEMDATEMMVKTGVAQAIHEPEEEIKVTSLRPAYGSTQNATVVLPGHLAHKVQELQRVKIGWVFCRIVPREEITRCFKCWEIGHLANKCSGPDRSKLCFNCGREGHYKAECAFKTACVECGAEGHRMHSLRCPKTLR